MFFQNLLKSFTHHFTKKFHKFSKFSNISHNFMNIGEVKTKKSLAQEVRQKSDISKRRSNG